jgi:probable HAF family extracellular repeat protein
VSDGFLQTDLELIRQTLPVFLGRSKAMTRPGRGLEAMLDGLAPAACSRISGHESEEVQVKAGQRTPVGLLLLALAMVAPHQALAEQYEVIDLGPIGYRHQTWSINQIGQVVGYSYELPAEDDEGFVYDGAEFILIGHPPHTSRSDLLGINIHGEAAGKSGTVHESGQAILWTPGGPPHGRIQSLGTLGGPRSAASSVNDLRQVVGWSHLPGDMSTRAFVWQDDQMDALPVLGGDNATAEWINNSGQIVGGSTTDSSGRQQFAVLWENDTVIQLPPFHPGRSNRASYIHDNGDIAGSVNVPGGNGFIRRGAIWRDGELFLQLGTLADGTPVEPFASSSATGTNADGVVVGMSVNALSEYVPFVWRDGQMTQLDELMPDPWVATFLGAGAINGAGQIAVSAIIPGESGLHALLLTPTGPTAIPDHETPNGYALSARAGEITYRIPDAAPVSLRVFDVSGKLVARLVDGVRPSGEHVTVWDGRTVHGVRVATGIYFAQLKTPGLTMKCRVLLVR